MFAERAAEVSHPGGRPQAVFGMWPGATMTQPRASWMAPPETLRLSARDLHVWKASLDLAPMWVQRLAETLSEDERARAGRFFLERDRSRFIACRGALRTILGRYLRRAPRSP